MSNLNSLFDIVRGWDGPHREVATISEVYRQHADVPANNPLKEGDIVFVMDDGKIKRADSANLAGAADIAGLAGLIATAKHYWLVIDGAEGTNYDNLSQTGPVGPNGTLSYVPWKVTCIRGTYMFETENFVGARAYAPGKKVAVAGGQADLIDAAALGAGYHPYAEVQSYDSTRGLLTLTT